MAGVAGSELQFDERIHIIQELIFLLYVVEILLFFIPKRFRNYLIPNIIPKGSPYTSLEAH
jgi:hypothetical protein